MATAAIIVSVVTLVLSVVSALYARRLRRQAKEHLDVARAQRSEASDLAIKALEIHERTMDEAPDSPELKVTLEHKSDPVLRPYEVLLVQMPDGDFGEITTDSGMPRDVYAEAPGAIDAIAGADYVIAHWPDGVAKVVKWRDRPTDTLEVRSYGTDD